jgi:hypothetical protein
MEFLRKGTLFTKIGDWCGPVGIKNKVTGELIYTFTDSEYVAFNQNIKLKIL